GVAPTLPARQPATSVEVELVSEHHDGLQRCGCEEPRVHDGPTFCITAPDSVSPGPNARLTTSVPGDTASSRASSIQMCGSVAEDMLPRRRSTSRLAAICDPSRSSASRTWSTIFGPPGCTA